MTSGARERAASSPILSSLAQSTASSTRSAASAGGSRTSPSRGMKAYSRGSGVSPARYITASLPSCPSATVAARSEPSASPSGFSCVTTRKRSCCRRASPIAFSSVVCVIVVRRELVDQASHAHAALDRGIVLEGQLRGPLQPQLTREPRLEKAVSRLETEQARALLAARAEHADVDRGVSQIGCRVDSGHRREADPRVFELRERLRQDLSHRLVHSPHALAHCSYSSAWLRAAPLGRETLGWARPQIDHTPPKGGDAVPPPSPTDGIASGVANP